MPAGGSWQGTGAPLPDQTGHQPYGTRRLVLVTDRQIELLRHRRRHDGAGAEQVGAQLLLDRVVQRHGVAPAGLDHLLAAWPSRRASGAAVHRHHDYGPHFHSDADVRRAIAGYSGLVSFMDEQMGQVLAALDAAGLSDSTLVLYTSDHGDNLGARGLWGKSTLYEESAGVPLMLAGPGIDCGRLVDTPASHVDCAVTILEAAGAPALPVAIR